MSSPWLLRLLRVTAGAGIGLFAFEAGYEWVGVTVALATAAFALGASFGRRRVA